RPENQHPSARYCTHICADGNSRRLWRRLQGISRESPGKSEPGCQPFIRLFASQPPAPAIADGGCCVRTRGWVKRRDFITLLGGAMAAWPLTARTHQAERMRRIGVLMGYPEGDPQAQANVTALLRGLQSLGWIEGRNVQIDYRWAGGDPEKAHTF